MITKTISLFMIALMLCPVPSQARKKGLAGNAAAPARELGHLQDPALDECSGIAASRRQSGLAWTHNDSGDGPFVYAIGLHGEKRGTFRLRGVSTVTDCEDIAIGPGPKRAVPYLYLGDIGDNKSERVSGAVYRFPEPPVTPVAKTSTQNAPLLTEKPECFRYVYPDGPHNAETLLVHPRTGRVYIIAKNKDGRDGVYVFPALDTVRTITLRKVGTLIFSGEPAFYPNLTTGGDISPDGTHVVVRTYWYAYEFKAPAGSADFDSVWRTKPARIELPLQPQGEGICYTYPGGNSFLLTSEGRQSSLYEVRRK